MSAIQRMPVACVMRTLEMSPPDERTVLLDSHPDARECVAVNLALDFVRQVRRVAAGQPISVHYADAWDAPLVQYMMWNRVAPLQLMENSAAPLRELLRDAVASMNVTDDDACIIPCLDMRDTALWIAKLLGAPATLCCSLIELSPTRRLRLLFGVGTRAAGPPPFTKHIDEMERLPMHCAAAEGHASCLQYLQSIRISDVNTKDRHQRTPLHHAASKGCARCIRLLAQFGADLDAQDDKGNTAVLLAARDGRVESLKELHERGASFNRTNCKLQNAAIVAAYNGHLECLRYLYEAAVDLFFVAEVNTGATVAHYAARGGHEECLRFFRAVGAPLSRADGRGWTPAHSAAIAGKENCLRTLHDLGADLHRTDRRGRAPLQCAIVHKQRGCVAFLHSLAHAAAGSHQPSHAATKATAAPSRGGAPHTAPRVGGGGGECLVA